MSAEALAFVWDKTSITAEEKLLLLWIANSSSQLGAAVMVDPVGMGEFIGAHFTDAMAVLESLTQKDLIAWGSQEEETSSYVWLVYGGPCEPPIDWTQETKRRSKRVAALIERDGPQCTYCQCMPITYEVDHFVPRAKGGPDKLDNLVLACSPCNRAKRDKMPHVFLSDRPELLLRLSKTMLAYAEDA